ncbi:hypothetical protein [Candidatus Magnetominusculus xianensis]|uniref:Membrane protein n=1 Tax=Candidatus Magnetominusculus xianensis TaxID=1748249 RepID=A0ABR5SFE6_9BACT|nr:hypothetical protein [Candidatus Magnetominusculus xianensis]KWT85932.1 membrane protein [Candidatus Magnetominusculus xianensis]MBF0403605.1 hypothetical protein [Nitrospirota bacterium]
MVPALIAVHIVSIVVWIGGVVFVTTVVFPIIMRMDDSMEKVMFFQGTERRFASIAKASVVVAGVTGVLLLQIEHRWGVLFTWAGIGPTVMLLLWAMFVFMLLFESNIFNFLFGGTAQHDTKKIFRILTTAHWVVMLASLMVIAVGVYTTHIMLMR